MKNIVLKQARPLFLVMIAFSLMLAPPLWATEESTVPQGKQEKSFFQGIKQDLDKWLGRNNSADKAQKEAPKPVEPKPKELAVKQSEGRKAINSFKKGMKKISNNVSESVERDKKTLKKKLNKLSDKK
jgi:hypothetical protein